MKRDPTSWPLREVAKKKILLSKISSQQNVIKDNKGKAQTFWNTVL